VTSYACSVRVSSVVEGIRCVLRAESRNSCEVEGIRYALRDAYILLLAPCTANIVIVIAIGYKVNASRNARVHRVLGRALSIVFSRLDICYAIPK
jgi:hypothetical protein